MTTNIQHFSDTIQQNPEDISKNDTSVERLRFYYKTLAEALWVTYESIDFIPSEYGNSFQTAAQAISYLQKIDTTQTQILLVNNAARSKHTDSGEAKGSYPLWCEVEINGITHHIVGVDDDAFELISCFQKAGTPLRQIQGVHHWNFHIRDTSKWSQFRSKDYFPLIQLIFIKELQEKWEVTEESIWESFDLIPYELAKNINRFKAKLLEQIGEKEGNLPQLEQVVKIFLTRTQEALESGENPQDYSKTYISPEFIWIEKVQIAGEFYRIWQDLWVNIFDSEFAENFIEEHRGVLQLYFDARNTLADNELLLIDRDKFWNCIFALSPAANSLESLLKLDYRLNEELIVEYPGGTLKAILTQTISDKTGENCIWQSSSTGPLGERFLNINTSFSHENSSPIAELQDLPLGSVVRFQGKIPYRYSSI